MPDIKYLPTAKETFDAGEAVAKHFKSLGFNVEFIRYPTTYGHSCYLKFRVNSEIEGDNYYTLAGFRLSDHGVGKFRTHMDEVMTIIHREQTVDDLIAIIDGQIQRFHARRAIAFPKEQAEKERAEKERAEKEVAALKNKAEKKRADLKRAICNKCDAHIKIEKMNFDELGELSAKLQKLREDFYKDFFEKAGLETKSAQKKAKKEAQQAFKNSEQAQLINII